MSGDNGRDGDRASSPCLLGEDQAGLDPDYSRGFRKGEGLGIEGANTILYCERWSETVDFYRHVLGLEASHATDWFVEFSLGMGAFVSVADAARSSIRAGHGRGLTLALRVADLDAAHAFLKARGAEPGAIREHPWGARVFYLRDPEGNRIECWQEL